MTVDEILKTHDLVGPYPQEIYVNHMDTAFGKDGGRFMDLVDELLASPSSQKSQNVFQQKNKSVAMSLYVSSHQNTPLFRGVLNFLESNFEKRPTSFRDIGCENGLLTLCLSSLWPRSSACGLDRSGRAIGVARKLAARFGQSAVKFEVADLTKSDSCRDLGQTDLVIASSLFHEFLMWCSEEEWQSIASNLRSMMTGTGRLLSITRFGDIHVARLNDRLQPAGLRPVTRSTLVIGDERVPVVVYARIDEN